jgi:hypothetical protein
MKKDSLRLSALFLILGLIACQLGLLLTLHQLSLLDLILVYLPNVGLVELLGIFLQLLGSALIVFGIVSVVNGIITEVTRDQAYQMSKPLLRIEEMVRELNLQRTQRTICKFCGTPIRDDSIFCPECGKSQK